MLLGKTNHAGRRLEEENTRAPSEQCLYDDIMGKAEKKRKKKSLGSAGRKPENKAPPERGIVLGVGNSLSRLESSATTWLPGRSTVPSGSMRGAFR